jgi:hypothetical protein
MLREPVIQPPVKTFLRVTATIAAGAFAVWVCMAISENFPGYTNAFRVLAIGLAWAVSSIVSVKFFDHLLTEREWRIGLAWILGLGLLWALVG